MIFSPVVSPIDRGKFVLVENFKFGEFEVPAGFVTDFDSVPRIPFFYDVFKGRTISAAIIHDYLYSQGFDRKNADNIFLRLMQIERVRKRYRLPIYAAVRVFGWIRFRKKSPPLNAQ